MYTIFCSDKVFFFNSKLIKYEVVYSQFSNINCKVRDALNSYNKFIIDITAKDLNFLTIFISVCNKSVFLFKIFTNSDLDKST